ncbi:MAG: HugZ family protein [Hyphomicrobiaceae bacterium]
MTEKKKDVLQPVDDEARRLAKNLVRKGRYASLATLDPIDGSPAASRVSLATTMGGDPIFLISRLSGHFTNLESDPRCSLLVGEPGKGDPLAYPRITLIGRAEKLTEGVERDRVKARYLMRHPKSSLYVDFPDFAFWRFAITRASLNGGFGKAFAPQAADLACPMAGFEQLEVAEAGAVAHMNSDHADAVDRYAASVGRKESGWKLACLDPEGLDLVCGDEIARLWFDQSLQSPDELRPTLVALAKRPQA